MKQQIVSSKSWQSYSTYRGTYYAELRSVAVGTFSCIIGLFVVGFYIGYIAMCNAFLASSDHNISDTIFGGIAIFCAVSIYYYLYRLRTLVTDKRCRIMDVMELVNEEPIAVCFISQIILNGNATIVIDIFLYLASIISILLEGFFVPYAVHVSALPAFTIALGWAALFFGIREIKKTIIQSNKDKILPVERINKAKRRMKQLWK